MVTVDLAVSDETEILLDLWQLYMQDLAEFRDSEVQADGRYRDDRLRTYLAYEDHWPFLIKSQGEIAGFALIRKSKPDTYLIGEFFIESEFRGTGISVLAVDQILQIFVGIWEIPFQTENSRAAIFWRKTIKKLGYQATEIASTESPADLLLIFAS